MANPSRAGWFGIPPERRFCKGCGVKVTLNKGPLWFDMDGVWHWEHYPAIVRRRAKSTPLDSR